MELDQLELFRNIANRGSISQAARDLFISQSALAKTLKQIETELDTPLFDRNGNNLVLNPAGEILLHYADIANNAMNNAENRIHNQRSLRENMVRVIFRIQLGNPIYAIHGFMRDCPKAIPHIATDAEVHGDYDLEVFSSSQDLHEEGIIKVCSDRNCLLMSANDPLANQTGAISIEDLRGRQFVAYRMRENKTAFFDSSWKDGFKPTVLMDYMQARDVLYSLRDGMLSVGPCVAWLNERSSEYTCRLIRELDEPFYLYIRINPAANSSTAQELESHLAEHLIASHNACKAMLQ